MDMILFLKKGDLAAINISFYHFGHNYGNKTYFFDVNSDDLDLDIIFAFISQFYQNHEIPKNIISNIDLEDNDDISNLLINLQTSPKIKDFKGESKSFISVGVNISYPKKGKKLQLIKDSLIFLQDEIDKKIANHSKIKNLLLQLK